MMISLSRRPVMDRCDESANQPTFLGRELLVLRELGIADRDELALQAGEAVLEDEIALTARPVDCVEVSLMEDAVRGLAPRVGAVLVKPPDVGLLPRWRVRVAPHLQVGL